VSLQGVFGAVRAREGNEWAPNRRNFVSGTRARGITPAKTIDRLKVIELASNRHTVEEIAAHLDVSARTLERRCADAIKRAFRLARKAEFSSLARGVQRLDFGIGLLQVLAFRVDHASRIKTCKKFKLAYLEEESHFGLVRRDICSLLREKECGTSH